MFEQHQPIEAHAPINGVPGLQAMSHAAISNTARGVGLPQGANENHDESHVYHRLGNDSEWGEM